MEAQQVGGAPSTCQNAVHEKRCKHMKAAVCDGAARTLTGRSGTGMPFYATWTQATCTGSIFFRTLDGEFPAPLSRLGRRQHTEAERSR